MKMAIRIWFILKHSYIGIFRFEFGSFGLDFLHPNKPIPNIQIFWWPIISQNVLNFIFAFLYTFLCKNIILGAKEKRNQSTNLPGHFFTFFPLVP